jgi:IS5 family transposase
VETTAANLHHLTPDTQIIHGEVEVVYIYAGYQGIEKSAEVEGRKTVFRTMIPLDKHWTLADT